MKLDWFVAVYDTKYSKESVTNPWPRNSMSWSLPLKLWKLFYAINFGWREDSSLASGGDNQCVTSPSCNPLRLAKHAANDRSNFHYCKIFICEFWSMDLLRKQTLFSICRCRCAQILKTVKSQKISLKCSCGSEHCEPVAASPLQALTTRQIFGIFYHLFSAESLWVRACSWSVWEDGLCKIHSIKCSKIVFLDLKCLKCRISFFIKHFTRSVVYNIFVAT